MEHGMMNNDTDLLERSRRALASGLATLDRIAETCCMPERSGEMTEASARLRKAMEALERAQRNQDALSESLENIAQCGSRIGRLYVTCCTEAREPLYQQLLKQLNEAYGNVERMLKKP
jgi:hypothetical protein